jgi:hypothetical protein
MNGPEFLIPIALFVSIASVVHSVLKYRERKLEIEMNAGLGVGRDSAGRLERMEQAIDAIAVEVERISEAQRFTTRLLADRSSGAHAVHAEAEMMPPHMRR